jgi:adenylate cyclase
VDAFAAAADDAERDRIEQRLWHGYGMEQAVLVADMSGYTRLTWQYGVVHFLAMMRRFRRLSAPLVERHGGHVMTFLADNCFARFDSVDQAIDAAVALNRACAADSSGLDAERRIGVACGIDFGPLLVPGGGAFAGAPVNLASKLGEDVALPGEILVAEAAFARCASPRDATAKTVTFAQSELNVMSMKY